MSKHTPGPWSAHPQALLGVHQPELQCWIPQNRADAQLIAAAPDLLAVLQDALKIVDAYRRVSGGDGDITAMNIRAAIAKATGGVA